MKKIILFLLFTNFVFAHLEHSNEGIKNSNKIEYNSQYKGLK